MTNSSFKNLTIASIFFIFSLSISFAGEKLKIFILAGQSNMVGPAQNHTIASLYHTGTPRDNALASLVFGIHGSEIKKLYKKQVEKAKRLDEITGGLGKEKLMKMRPGQEKTKLEAEAQKLEEEIKVGQKKIANSCIQSNKVYINSIAGNNKRAGKLGVGYGWGTDHNRIGPEYSFGLTMAKKLKSPILIIKASWGGKSINHNFRPPSSGEFVVDEVQKQKGNEEKLKKSAGEYYRLMNDHIRKVLGDLKANHPEYNEKAGYEIAGFVWFQGFNDQFSDYFRDSYKTNMINFIKDIRKEYQTSNMPFVIGVLGTNITKENVDKNKVVQGQRAAAKNPEFKDNVLAVESYKDFSMEAYEVYKRHRPKHINEWFTIGGDKPYHYLGSGAFEVRVGNSFANAMIELMSMDN